MSEFICVDCNKRFESKGKKVEYLNPIYGPCFKYISICSDCGKECDEFRAPKKAKQSNPIPPCGNPGASCNCM